jgi:hypothetical protein
MWTMTDAPLLNSPLTWSQLQVINYSLEVQL